MKIWKNGVWFILLLCIGLFAIHVNADDNLTTLSDAGYSAVRGVFETYQQALERQLRNHSSGIKGSALNSAVPINLIDYSKVPQVSNYAKLFNIFQEIRDSSFLMDITAPAFTRRITWLYPQDFCYTRAAIAGELIAQSSAVQVHPYKIFAFGNLSVKTPYDASGKVSWWYHVALILGVNNKYYVLDPAVNSNYPLPVNKWYALLNDPLVKGGSL